ncbi:MAG: 2-isopropylmalate synthase [Proteobacteria bacterium]|nr:2-isopropylmalate synthase [Desulfocapsa sp.]MBU3946177.1 2-isopropylmalate synthase [Pseudomonadota bacterium]MCG2745189.1 2-isopropylmalate synthase [Desulfobacteraceae bacterium]MBU3984341.1 2-isopropylmalate synthase [Pseudomonadota bacterium]MBU4027800.1 2-isopropylmalate synthase [Pseudomonadota bacterium]
MNPDAVKKYRPYPRFDLPTRTWPEKTITKAPAWCSVDLRDGNQALVQPMNLEEKLELFQLLVDIGFKEVEIGFPSASQVEFDFSRTLIERALIPEDVTIQILTPAREHLIKRSFEALKGAKQAVVHLYNSTSTLQRRIVFQKNRAEIVALAIEGAQIIRQEAALSPETSFRYEYSPESFTGTELDFALEICEAVMGVWEPTPENPVIINLPATVEMATPNVYADQIEWFCENMKHRDCALISLHAHNDRGCAVAATELALMAGGDRVEGTLFGNGERTGNVDLITLALNMFTQGIDPGLNLHDINQVISVSERVTRIPVHVRHPYAGELVYTAFSGSHQDAINKGMNACDASADGIWAVPYLPIDPKDVGRSYESIIRINSQSGKGGVAWIMDREFGFKMPKEMHPEFGGVIQKLTDRDGRELQLAEVWAAFKEEYLTVVRPYGLTSFNVLKRHVDADEESSSADVEAVISVNGESQTVSAIGNGPLDAFCEALKQGLGCEFTLCGYHEHALTKGSSSKAVAYIETEYPDGRKVWGAGVDTDIIIASIKATLCSLNRAAHLS